MRTNKIVLHVLVLCLLTSSILLMTGCGNKTVNQATGIWTSTTKVRIGEMLPSVFELYSNKKGRKINLSIDDEANNGLKWSVSTNEPNIIIINGLDPHNQTLSFNVLNNSNMQVVNAPLVVIKISKEQLNKIKLEVQEQNKKLMERMYGKQYTEKKEVPAHRNSKKSVRLYSPKNSNISDETQLKSSIIDKDSSTLTTNIAHKKSPSLSVSDNQLTINGVKIFEDNEFPKGQNVNFSQVEKLAYGRYNNIYYYSENLKVLKRLNNRSFLCGLNKENSGISGLFSGLLESEKVKFIIKYPYDVPFLQENYLLGLANVKCSYVRVVEKIRKNKKDIVLLTYNGYLEYKGKKFPDSTYSNMKEDFSKTKNNNTFASNQNHSGAVSSLIDDTTDKLFSIFN